MARLSNRALWTTHLKAGSISKAISPVVLEIKEPFSGYVLGIDPSVRGTGLALLKLEKGMPTLVQSHTLNFSARYTLPDCLGQIYQVVSSLLEGYEKGHVALESTVYVQNFQIVHKLGAARGAAIAAANLRGWDVFEYAPLRIKQATVGSGRASKEQVCRTMTQHLRLKACLPSDEADAAATALCHAWTFKSIA